MAHTPEENIDNTPVTEELGTSFLSYAMSVIVSRALPDVRDGLKPVHRRILYSMEDLNLQPTTSYVKCARVVGDAIGRLHPHGDSAVYEALVRMAQDFSMSLPLVDGHGNFGTHSDPAAAMRYCLVGDTRLRLADGTSRRLADVVNLPLDSEADAELDVLDKDGKSVRATKVFNSGVHPTREVTTNLGFSLRGSHNHPLLCLEQGPLGNPILVWKTLDTVRPGDWAVIARNAWEQVTPTAREYNLGVLLGGWVSEGWASAGRAGFNNTDRHYFDEVLSAYDAVVGGHRYLGSRTLKRSGKPIHEIDVQRTGIDALRKSPLGELVGHRSDTKFVPEAVWQGGWGVKRAFLSALFEGDGGVRDASPDSETSTFTIHYSTRSETLARQVQELLAEFGVIASRLAYLRSTGKLEHRLIISGLANIRAFAHRIGFLRTKQSMLRELLTHSPNRPHRLSRDFTPFVSDYIRSRRVPGQITWLRQNNFDRFERWNGERQRLVDRLSRDPEALAAILPVMDSGYRFDQVRSVTETAPEPVYSIRVDTDDHSFLAGGFVNHNTECRMSHAAVAMTGELDEDTVEFKPNYDGSFQEPTVLPAAFPNLLVNGTEGIAVGMATKIPPHNLVEVVAACRHLLAHPDATVDDLIQHIPAPDMPTGGLLLDIGGAHEAYRTGRGSFRMRARTEIVGRDIVVTELPYQVGPERVIEAIKKVRDAGRLDEVSSVVDLSDRNAGLRLVITAKRNSKGVPVNPAAVLKKLFKYTPLEESFAVHNLALVDSQPRTLTLLEMVTHFVNHRLEVTRRRCEFRKRKAEARAHLLEGYLIALANIDEIVALIKASRDTDTARKKLQKTYKLSEIQATNILEMPLRRLTSLEVRKIKDELAELKKRIAELTRYLTDDKAMRGLVSDELGETADRFGVPRRSQITTLDSAALAAEPEEDLSVPDVPCRIQLATTGKIGRFDTAGHKGARTKEDALVAWLECSVRDVVGAVTDSGRLLHLHPMDVPVCEGKNRGGRVEEFISDLARDEKVVGLVRTGADAEMVAIATASGVVKRVAAKDFAKASGQPVIGLKDGDSVVGVVTLPRGSEDEVDLVIVTDAAQLLRFSASTVRPQGRTGGGVAGVRLGDDARVIAFGAVIGDASAVTLSDAGSVKHTPAAEYPAKGRGGAGVRCQRFGRGETKLVAAKVVPLAQVAAVTDTGALGKLPVDAARRDAAGERLGFTGLELHRP